MHSIVHFSPLLAGILLSIDYLMNIVLIVYLRILHISENRDKLMLSNLQLEKFVNEFLFNEQVNFSITFILVGILLYFIAMYFTTNHMKPRRKSSSWKLHLLLTIQYSIHTCFSVIIVTNQSVSIFAPTNIENFSSLKGAGIYRAFLAFISAAIYLANSYFIENIYNFQFMGINGETGILSNTKRLTLLMPLLKYLAIMTYFADLSISILSVVFTCISLIYLIQLYIRFNQSYNFSKFLSEIEVVGIALCAYNYGFCVILTILNIELRNGDLLIAIAFNVFLAVFIYLLKKNSWNKKLYQNFLTMKSISGKEIFAYRMLECILENSFEDQLLVNGVIKTHKKTCLMQKCPCTLDKMIENINDRVHLDIIVDFKINGELQSLQEYENTKKNDFSQAIQFQGSLKSLKDSQQLVYINILLAWLQISFTEMKQHRMRMIQAYISTDVLHKDLTALFYISTLNTIKLSIQEKSAIFCYQKIIFDKVNERMKNKSSQSLEISQIQKSVFTERKLKKLYSYIENTVHLCTDFWNQFQINQKDLDFQKLYVLSLEIAKLSLSCDKHYRKIREAQPEYEAVIVYYERFLRDILNYENDAQKEANDVVRVIQKKRIQNLRSQAFKDEIFDLNKKIGIIVMRASHQQIGKINIVNDEITIMTGYDSKRLKNANISVIIPTIISEVHHNMCIEQFFSHKTSTSFINKKQTLWVRDSSGYLNIVDVLAQPFYDQIEGLQFIGYIKKSSSLSFKDVTIKTKDVMAFTANESGVIQESTRNLAETLKYSNSQDLRNADLSVWQICPELDINCMQEKLLYGFQTLIHLNENQIQSSLEGCKHSIQNISENTNNTHSHSHNSDYAQDQQQNIESNENEDNLQQTSSHTNFQSFGFLRQRIVSAYVKADLKYWQNHQFFKFGVFFIALNQTQKNIKNEAIKLQEQTENQQDIDTKILEQFSASQTYSGSSSSGSRQSHSLLNMKSEFVLKKRPRVIGILQKLFILYFLVFLALSSAIVGVSFQNTQDFVTDLQHYYYARALMFELAEMRKNAREYVFYLNNQTILEVPILSQRKDFLAERVTTKIERLKYLTNKLNSFILSQKESQMDAFIEDLLNVPVQLNNLMADGTITKTEQAFIPSLERFITSIQTLITYENNFKCSCFFRPLELDSSYSYSVQERTFFFINNNSLNTLGNKIWKAANVFFEVIVSQSSELKDTILYFSIPGMIVSILCSLAFLPVIFKSLKNRTYIILMLSQMKHSTASNQLKKIKDFKELMSQKVQKQKNLILLKSVLELNEESKNPEVNQKSLINNTNLNETNMSFVGLEEYKQEDQRSHKNRQSDKQTSGINQEQEIHLDRQKLQELVDKDCNEQNERLITQQINQAFRKKLLCQSINISLVSIIFCLFFVALFFLTTEALNDTEQSLQDFSAVLTRAVCISSVPLYTKQMIIRNQSSNIDFLNSDNIDDLYDYCLLNNYQFQDLRKFPSNSMKAATNFIERTETYELCSIADEIIDSSELMENNKPIPCSKAIDGIILKGMQSTYSFFLSEFRKFQIQFESSPKDAATLLRLIRNEKFILYTDVITLYIMPVLNEINEQVSISFIDYYEALMQRSLIFYIVFVIVIFIAVIVGIAIILKALQNEIYFNKKIIKFIPFSELKRKSYSKMLKQISF